MDTTITLPLHLRFREHTEKGVERLHGPEDQDILDESVCTIDSEVIAMKPQQYGCLNDHNNMAILNDDKPS